MAQEFSVRTQARSEFRDITSRVQQFLDQAPVSEGICHIYVPHTTAGITINENADPDVTADIIASLDRHIPWNDPYRHAEGNSAAHLKASLMGFTAIVPVRDGRLMLGTWQAIYFCEFDGPRNRRVVLTIIGQ